MAGRYAQEVMLRAGPTSPWPARWGRHWSSEPRRHQGVTLAESSVTRRRTRVMPLGPMGRHLKGEQRLLRPTALRAATPRLTGWLHA